ncbi:transglycosylase domain-containing protein [Piscibacillus salipiscarius]|nr:penicillin-binding transpeptidase domain-containing protein [Piscibacillus salipiscarius]
MHETGKITETTMTRAKQEELNFVAAASEQEPEVGKYFQDYAMDQASNILGIDRQAIDTQGYQIYTTINQDAQKKLEDTIKQELPEDSEELQIGAVTIDPRSSKIVAMQGGRDFDQTPYNRVTQAERMTGSTFKAFLYYAALVYGFTPSTLVESRETTFTLENDETYTPGNAGDFANRPVTLAQALAVSDNIYAIKTAMEIGPENIVEAARAFGIEADLKAVPSIAIGTGYLSPLEMTKAYSVLANQGWSVKPYVIEKIVDRDGNIVYQHQAETPKRLLEENHAFVLTHMLTGMFNDKFTDYMRATGANVAPIIQGHQYAGKSGSTDFDSWMIGFTPEYTTAVWTGYDDHREMTKVQDFRVSKQVWAKYMSQLHAGLPTQTFNVPTGVVGLKVDPISGKLEGPACEDRSVMMYYIKGTQPKEVCSE